MIKQTQKNKWLTIIGCGTEGFNGLSQKAKETIEISNHLFGSTRQLSLIEEEKSPNAVREIWPSPMMPRIEALAEQKPNNTVIIASGDPLCWGIGQHFSTHLDKEEFECLPSVSILTRTANIMHWPTATTPSISLCSQRIETLSLYLQQNQKLILLSAGKETPEDVGQFLTEKGFGQSKITVLENLGNETETIKSANAETITSVGPFSALNSLAIHLKSNDQTSSLSCLPGLPNKSYEHDGQMTKQNMRAITLAHLRPNPGELLWDIGSGSGSIAIEWLRTGVFFMGTPCKAIGFEKNQTRLERAQKNAIDLGVPQLKLILGNAEENILKAEAPDAIFIGGGITTPGLLDNALKALKPGGRLVANTVTIEGAAKLIENYKNHGGSLSQIAMSNADPVGHFHGMRPQMSITQWVFNKSAKVLQK